MKVNVRKLDKDLSQLTLEALVVGVFQNPKKEIKLEEHNYLQILDELIEGSLERYIKKNSKFGKIFESVEFQISPKKHKSLEKVVLVGLGKAEKLDNYKLKQVAGFIGKQAAKNVKSLGIYFPQEADIVNNADILVNGFAAGTFNPGHHKTGPNGEDKRQVENLTIFVKENQAKAQKEAEVGLLISETLAKVREVVNLPANIATPQYMVKFAKEIAKRNSLMIQVFSEEEVNTMGMRIMASVAKGSDEDLYFVIMKYAPKGAKKTLALVGKGITFDSGGLSIKPSENMEWMKMDMAGAAAVFGAMEVIAKFAPKINVVAAVPLTENLPSGKASKPGDVVKGLSGKTVEIVNTDAEGRLVLADALTYVQKNIKPDYMIDVATLTGAAIVALGNWASAVLGRPQEFVDLVKKSADEAGERVWQLPLYDEYRDQLKSYIADISNVSSIKGGGAETGAKFLEEFVDEKANWAHLDIAPNAWEEQDKPYASKGSSGVALATLVNLALELEK